MKRKIRRGDMYYADLTGIGSEQLGFRPNLILSNDTGNKHSHTVIAAVITSRVDEKADLPTHCKLNRQQELDRDSLVLLEQLRTIDTSRLAGYVGTLDGNDMSNVDKALAISVGLKYISDT